MKNTNMAIAIFLQTLASSKRIGIFASLNDASKYSFYFSILRTSYYSNEAE